MVCQDPNSRSHKDRSSSEINGHNLCISFFFLNHFWKMKPFATCDINMHVSFISDVLCLYSIEQTYLTWRFERIKLAGVERWLVSFRLQWNWCLLLLMTLCCQLKSYNLQLYVLFSLTIVHEIFYMIYCFSSYKEPFSYLHWWL